MRRITTVIARPMSGSAICRPSATTAADATTASDTYASARAWLPSATSAGLSSGVPARVRTIAAIQLPANPSAPAAASAPRCSTSCGSTSRAIASYPATHAETKIAKDDEQPREALGAGRAQRERDAERDRRRGVAEVVDEIGEQRDAAGRDEHRDLRERGDAEDEQREQHGPHALARALDRVVHQAVRVAVVVREGWAGDAHRLWRRPL